VANERRSLRELNRATLARQALLERARGAVPDVIGQLAGLQAQGADPPYVALWSRRESQTIADLEAALTARTVVKATLMRSTLHLVDARDHPAFDAATAVARVTNWRPTARRAGVSLVDLHARLLEFCEEPRSVAEIEAWVEAVAPGLASAAPAGVRNTGFRAASAGGGLVHVPPSGLFGTRDKPTYVAARVWLPDLVAPSAEEALRIAVTRYLAAYGPASIGDIGKWLGETRHPRIRAAIASLGGRITRSTGDDGRELVDLTDMPSPPTATPAPARFLSRWDSALIAYDVRDRILPAAYRSTVAKSNADFLPAFLVDGFVAGLWSFDRSKTATVIRLEPLGGLTAADRQAVLEEADHLVHSSTRTRRDTKRSGLPDPVNPRRTASTWRPCSSGQASCRGRLSCPTGERSRRVHDPRRWPSRCDRWQDYGR
jgi:hypothetical protein